jgi:hypothetical protein
MRIAHRRKNRTDVLLVVRVLLKFLVVCIVEHFELLLYGSSLASANRATARVLLLLLHLAQYRLFFYLDQRFAFVLAQRQPELSNALALLLS